MGNPKANQTTPVTTFGQPSCAQVAEAAMKRHAVYRAQQRKLEEIEAAKAAERARNDEEKAARTREATRAAFWDI